MPLEIRRRARAQAPWLTVAGLVVAVVIYLSVQPSHWRRGVGVIAIAMIVAAVLRVVLSRRRAGLLSVRNRWFDVACYLAVGVLLLIADLRLRS